MKIKKILALIASKDSKNIEEAVKQLKGVTKEIKIDDIRNQLDPMEHKVMKVTHRPNKKIKKTPTSPETEELVARVPLALQKLIVERAVGFTFGFNPKIKAEPNGEIEISLLKAFKDVLNVTKSNSLNGDLATDLYSCTQVAEMWFGVELKEKQKIYGFDSDFKLKNAIFSPLRGDNLYPLYDDFGDMVAFSRSFTVDNIDGRKTYFTTYTETNIIKFDITSGIILIENVENKLGKIPIVFATQPNVEWYLVQTVIERLELLMSNFADTNDYNGSPILFGKGSLGSAPTKGSTGKFITGQGQDADLKYVSWEQAPESIRLEIEKLYEVVYGFTQTPNISFEMVKGIGTTSGIALKLLFMDAHLKVQAKRRIWDTYFIRRANIIKEWLCIFNPIFLPAKNMFIELEIVPYTIVDYAELYGYLTAANGGLPVIAHDTSIQMTGEVDDVVGEMEKIKLSLKEQATVNAFPENQ